MRRADGADAVRVSADCFRVVALTTEIQNEAEVVKPVLDEIEVIRLSSALGLLPSVTARDFEHDWIAPEEFDDEFAHYLRRTLLRESDGANANALATLGLFGKQQEVKRALTRFGVWSVEMDSRLKSQDQGIYCVKCPGRADDEAPTLMLFSWIQDPLFDASRLRDTATYVLRFLGCMSADLQCCLSPRDVAEVEEAVRFLSAGSDSWSPSFSVGFLVEKQEDKKDGVHCDHVGTIDLPDMGNGQDIVLLKGNYPALSTVLSSPPRKRTVTDKLSFSDERQFAEWAVSQAQSYALMFDFSGMKSSKYQNELLQSGGCFPHAELAAVDSKLTCSLDEAKDQCREVTHIKTEDRRARLLGMANKLFDIDTLLGTASHVGAEHETLKRILQAMKARTRNWDGVDEKTRVLVYLPMRLKNQMKEIFAVFHEQYQKGSGPDRLGVILEALPYEAKKVTHASSGNILSRALSFFTGGNTSAAVEVDEAVVRAFRERMKEPLINMRVLWWDGVDDILTTTAPRIAQQITDTYRQDLMIAAKNERLGILMRAFDKQLERYLRSDEGMLRMALAPRNRNERVYCDVKREVLEPATDQLHVFKLICEDDGQPRADMLGYTTLSNGQKLMRCFTIGRSGVLMVTVTDSGTDVFRADFLHGQGAWSSRGPQGRRIKHFGRLCTLCDFNYQERLMAFVTADKQLFVFRFNDKFESMEAAMKPISLDMQTSLSTVVDAVVADNSVYLVDEDGSTQSINFRLLQTSRKQQQPESEQKASRSELLLLSDGLALARLAICARQASSSEFVGELNVLASEDFRSIPADFPDVTFLSSDVAIGCYNDKLFVVDAIASHVEVFGLALTVRSDSYRIRHSSESEEMGTGDFSAEEANKHWLRALYHVYEKFPVGGLIESVSDNSTELRLRVSTLHLLPDRSTRACRDFLECVMNDLRKLNKSLGYVDFTREVRFVNDEMDDEADGWRVLKCSPINAFVQNVVTFVPVQICRAEGNTLSVMENGLAGAGALMDQVQSVQAADIARSIRFGLLSPLLNAWNGPVGVITSMGKQSTGKSYILNHLTGSSFAIAGARCTDGAWMSIRLLPAGVMLVVLDFEGLGSFERSEQEDVLLSVLNASISMFTIFRMEMRFDKEMDDLFARFQKGVALLKGDSRLFRGLLYMSVKDVNPNDQKGVLDEFVAKIRKLLGVNKEHNFLTDLYTGRLEINCSPPLGTLNYYRSLGHARNCIDRDLFVKSSKAGFQSGKSFLDCIRLVLAKISILDWTSLDESAQKFVLSEAVDKLPGLVRTGNLIPRDQVDSKSSLADVSEAVSGIDDSLEALCMAHPMMQEKWVMLASATKMDQLRDGSIDLGFNVCAVMKSGVPDTNLAIQLLVKTFTTLYPSDGSEIHLHLSHKLQSRFDDFLSFFVRRRCLRISQWAKSKFNGRVPDEWKSLEQQQLGRFTALFTRCQSKCGSCRLGCMKSAMHTGELDEVHDCGTSHQCQKRCQYCLAKDAAGKTPACSKEAGHDGQCECEDGDHTCGKLCHLSISPSCGQKCTAKSGHDGRHHCDVSLHSCGEPCSLPQCAGQCILSIEKPHTAHKCVEVACIDPCIMDGCAERCGEMDHFHGHTDVAVAFSVENQVEGKEPFVFDADTAPPVIHMCNKEHACPAVCTENGICRVEVRLKQSSKEFAGARGKFKYTYQEMNGSRKKCGQALAPKQQTHPGKHSCILGASTATSACSDDEDGDTPSADTTMHYCDVRCPCCSYYCNKEHGHTGLHATSHGNMRNTFFMSDTMDIDIDDRKYRAGETGEAEMCNLYCSKMGRAHVHYLECEQNSKESCVYSGTTNDQRRHCGRALEPKPDCEMDEVLHEQFWRTLGWMDPCTSSAERELFKKCDFSCSAPNHSDNPSLCVLPAWHAPIQNPSGAQGSGGFSYTDGHKFECPHTTDDAKHHHVFVLDSSGSMCGQPWSDLLTAVGEYVSNCISSGASLDLVSIVTFDSRARIVCEAVAASALNISVPFMGGRTSYHKGLQLANDILSRTDFNAYKPVLVFFSDGYPHEDGGRFARYLRRQYEMFGLKAYAVGFGHANLDILEQLARRMGGEYHNVLTGTEMKTTFRAISASITRAGLALAKQPTHDVDCPICCKDLASQETRTLARCKHVLHQPCLVSLQANAAAAGEPVVCPICRCEASEAAIAA